MVVEGRASSGTGANNTTCLRELASEFNCWKRSLMLYPIDMKTITPQFYSVLMFALFLSLQLFILTLPFIINYGKLSFYNSVTNIFIYYLLFLIYGFSAGYLYRKFLKKESDSSYLSYVAVCLYAFSYSPLCIFLAILLKGVGFIFTFALALIAQFYVSSCFTYDYSFTNTRDIFIFSLMTIVIEFIFVAILQTTAMSFIMGITND